MKTGYFEYLSGDTVLEGFYAYDADNTKQRPAVLVAHDWSGKNEFACDKAKQLASLGYAGFAIDMFGKGITGSTKEEKSALIQPLLADRALLQKRMLTGFEKVKSFADFVDTTKVGAIGFCFGGLCVLDLARSGADIQGVVSFHGLLNAPEKLPHHKISAKVLALHGFDDPMVTPDQVMAFGHEMTKAQANWELDMYGNTMHAFTNPQANDPGFGTVYNLQASQRSWNAMKLFFQEVFGK